MDPVAGPPEDRRVGGRRTDYRRRRTLVDRWHGTSIEWAHYHLHAAKILLANLLPDDDVDARLPAAIARIATCLDPRDIRRLHLDQLLQDEDRGRRRAGLKQALEIGYDASDQLHSRVRTFRNTLYKAGMVIGGLMIVLIAVVASSPHAVPFCFEPAVPSTIATRSDASTGERNVKRVCPSGEDQWVNVAGKPSVILQNPSPADITIVAGLGVLGGALSAAFAIRKVRGTSTPYDVPLALAMLKVPTGALTAVTGILLLGGGFVPGLSELDSQDQILADALVLGYAQQLGTQFIDQRVQSLLNSVPSKDPEAAQPTGSAPTTAARSRGERRPDRIGVTVPRHARRPATMTRRASARAADRPA